MKNKSIEKAVELCGSQKKLAQKLGVTQQLISYAIQGKRRLSVINAIKIEKVTNGEVKRKEIRPDIDWNELN